jgi:hypothetical protein
MACVHIAVPSVELTCRGTGAKRAMWAARVLHLIQAEVEQLVFQQDGIIENKGATGEAIYVQMSRLLCYAQIRRPFWGYSNPAKAFFSR